MHQQSVTLDLPGELYKRIQETAEENRTSLENMLVESIALMFGDLPPEETLSAEDLEKLTDDHLWAIVHRRLTWLQDARLQQLTTLGKRDELSDEEALEMERLIDEVDRYVLLRSKALLLLKQRGYDVEQRLKIGA